MSRRAARAAARPVTSQLPRSFVPLSALSGSTGGFGTNTLGGRKQGAHLVPTSTALQHRGSGTAVDVDTLQSGTKRWPAECRRALLQVNQLDSLASCAPHPRSCAKAARLDPLGSDTLAACVIRALVKRRETAGV